MPTRELTRECQAKVNLALAVGPPIAPDRPRAGFHPICSWMSCIDLSDWLRVRQAERASSFSVCWQDGRTVDWPVEKDLVFRAHRALESFVGRNLPIELELRKQIPAGGGLGGGSADAGSTLLAVNDLFELDLSVPVLQSIAGSLGSDVAFFVDVAQPPAPAIVSGLGERLERLPRLDAELVLICPDFACPTQAVYAAFDAQPTGQVDESRIHELVRRADLARLFNDLTSAAERVQPRLSALRRRITDLIGTMPHLSGSGSTLFMPGGVDLSEQLRAALPETRIICAKTI